MKFDITRGITFGDVHTYRDLGLILKSYPLITPPEVQSNYVEVKGRNGSIDLAPFVDDVPKYKNRTITVDFKYIGNRERWPMILSDILAKIHGKTMEIILDDDINFFYRGLVSITNPSYAKNAMVVSISCNVEPYKYEVKSDWLWDPFDFEEDIITEIRDITVHGTATETIIVRRQNSYPILTCTAPMTLEYKGNTYNLVEGINKVYDCLLDMGENDLKFTGNGVVTADYLGGTL